MVKSSDVYVNGVLEIEGGGGEECDTGDSWRYNGWKLCKSDERL